MTRLLTLLTLAALLSSCQLPPGPNPDDGNHSGNLELSRDALVFNAGGAISRDTRTLTVTNDGDAALTMTAAITSRAFTLPQPGPLTLAAGASLELPVTFTPSSAPGPQQAVLTLESDLGETASVALGGLSVVGQEGTKEPSLQWIFDTFGFPVQTGDTDPTTSAVVEEVTNSPVGDEVVAQTFIRADPAEPVTVQVLATFAVPDVAPIYTFGVYPAGAAEPTLTRLFELPITPTLNGQKLEPAITPFADTEAGLLSFEPPADTFGFYSLWPTTPFFDERTVYSEDARNTFPNSLPHHIRVYPLKDRDGELVPSAFILATDESKRLNDFNDAVLLVRNVQPAQ